MRCLSQCVGLSPKISIFTTLLFALGTPLWQSRKTFHKLKDNLVFAKSIAACTHLSPTVSQLFELQVQKIAIFTPTFLFPLITQYVAWMEREFNACQPFRSMYLSIFNSFRVIRCLSQCVSPKIAIFTYRSRHFCFHYRHPGDYHTICCIDGNLIPVKPLAACTHLSSTVSELFQPQVPKIAVFTYRSPHFCFSWRRPCDYHAMCCMDGKTIQCLPNPSQHMPIYLQ